MKVTFKGPGTVYLEGFGEVAAGGTVEVPAELGRDLLKRDDWTEGRASGPKRDTKPGGGD